MTPLSGVHIQTLRSPDLYTVEQIEEACGVARLLGRGVFALVCEPEGEEDERDG